MKPTILINSLRFYTKHLIFFPVFLFIDNILHHIQAYFKSTRPCGTRPVAYSTSSSQPKFQSTRPCGTRPFLVLRSKFLIVNFNPRAPVGRDTGYFIGKPVVYSFQSTHPCGTRHTLNNKIYKVTTFQSTRPCGTRHIINFL